MGSLFHQIYVMPLTAVVFWIILLIIFWADLALILKDKNHEKGWIRFNRILLVLFLIVLAAMTVFSRESGNHAAKWEFLGKLFAARNQKELYREMLMNIFMFVPFGFMAPFAVKKADIEIRTRALVPKVILTGLVLSVIIEMLQLALSVGLPEAEDVICNTLGAAAGTLSFLIWNRVRNK